MTTNEIDLNNDILGKKSECLSIPICININDEEVEISKNLERYSIIDIVSKYNKDLASEINKMNMYKIEHPKPKNHTKIQLCHARKHLIIKTNILMIKFKVS
jgi:hypothetical protein